MTVAEAARRLEVKSTVVYQLCALKLLAHSRVGVGRGVIRISEDDLKAYADSAHVEAEGPTHRQAPRRTGLAVRDYIGEAIAEDARRLAAEPGGRRRGGGRSAG